MIGRKRAGGPRGLAATVPKVTKPLFRARGFAEAGVLTDWPDIVGRPLADYTCPERLARDGTLHLRVSGGWGLELKHLEPMLLERIAGYFGYRAVTRLALVQGPLPPRTARRRRRVRALDADEEAALRTRLAAADDPELRAALDRLGRALIGGSAADDDDGEDAGLPLTEAKHSRRNDA
ncbi:MAG: DUF721 domain-containing protein [Alphaproteobacteria bacterium]